MSSPELIVYVGRLENGPQSLRGSASPMELDIADETHFLFHHDVNFNLRAELISGRVVVRGSLTMECEMECRRCAEFFSTIVNVSSFLRVYDVKELADTLDLTADVREDIFLALPPYPLCSESCKGLCPHCGKNLNEGPCDCHEEPEPNEIWAVLNKLHIPDAVEDDENRNEE